MMYFLSQNEDMLSELTTQIGVIVNQVEALNNDLLGLRKHVEDALLYVEILSSDVSDPNYMKLVDVLKKIAPALTPSYTKCSAIISKLFGITKRLSRVLSLKFNSAKKRDRRRIRYLVLELYDLVSSSIGTIENVIYSLFELFDMVHHAVKLIEERASEHEVSRAISELRSLQVVAERLTLPLFEIEKRVEALHSSISNII